MDKIKNTPYIGSKISLISNLAIRYEGVLYGVDAVESTITLSKVRFFGTEDRSATRFIPGRPDDVFEYIVFKASDIKDLVLISDGYNKSKQIGIDDSLHYDPAIISVTKQEAGRKNERSILPAKDPAKMKQVQRPSVIQLGVKQNYLPSINQHQLGSFLDVASNPFAQKPIQNKQSNFNPNRFIFESARELANDYDFDKANERFKNELGDDDDTGEKDAQVDNDENETPAIDQVGKKQESEICCYDKNVSFFDSISSGDTDRAEGKSRPPNWGANQETFGRYAIRSFLAERNLRPDYLARQQQPLYPGPAGGY